VTDYAAATLSFRDGPLLRLEAYWNPWHHTTGQNHNDWSLEMMSSPMKVESCGRTGRFRNGIRLGSETVRHFPEVDLFVAQARQRFASPTATLRPSATSKPCYPNRRRDRQQRGAWNVTGHAGPSCAAVVPVLSTAVAVGVLPGQVAVVPGVDAHSGLLRASARPPWCGRQRSWRCCRPRTGRTRRLRPGKEVSLDFDDAEYLALLNARIREEAQFPERQT
jgi:hypothetical protein